MNVVAMVSQKGGVGKSTLARAVASEACRSELKVKLADLDTQQGTVTEWHRQRLHNGFNPVGSVELFDKAARAVSSADGCDLLVIDGAPRASSGTLEISKCADLVVMPCCASRDDLIPALKLAFELEKKGISRTKVVFALVRVTTDAEIQDARDYIEQSGFSVLDGCLYEKPAYRQAQNDGLSVTETRYRSLNEKANELLESMLTKLLGE